MARHRSHSAAFKRQVAEEFLAGETLHGLSQRHDISGQLIRIWLGKYEAGALDGDFVKAGRKRSHLVLIRQAQLWPLARRRLSSCRVAGSYRRRSARMSRGASAARASRLSAPRHLPGPSPNCQRSGTTSARSTHVPKALLLFGITGSLGRVTAAGRRSWHDEVSGCMASRRPHNRVCFDVEYGA